MAKAKSEAVKITAATPKIIRVTLVKSAIGYSVRHKETIRALGLHRMNQTVEHVDTPTLRGMLYKVSHLVEVSEAVDSTAVEA